MGIPREFPARILRFLGIPKNSHTGGLLALQGDFWIYRGNLRFNMEVFPHCAAKKFSLRLQNICA
jgi:hypothetical protein